MRFAILASCRSIALSSFSTLRRSAPVSPSTADAATPDPAPAAAAGASRAAARRRRYSSTPPGRCRSPPFSIAYCWSVTRSMRYRSCETTNRVPGHESSRSSSAASMSVSRSLEGSSRISTFGSPRSTSSNCSRRFCPPDRSRTGVDSSDERNPSRSSSWVGLSSLPPETYEVFCSARTSRTRTSAYWSSSVRRWLSTATCTVLPRLTRPDVGCTAPDTRPSSVDLPTPLGPRMPVRSPGAMRHSMSFSTGPSP